MKVLKTITYVILFAFLILYTEMASAEVKIAVLDSGTNLKLDKGISFTSLSVNSDPIGHGTKISQIIRRHNPSAKIFMVQVCRPTSTGYEPDINAVKKGIAWARQMGAKVVNMSLTLNSDQEMINLIEDASRKDGMIFVAAAGNMSFHEQFVTNSDFVLIRDTDTKDLKFPANVGSVISVGATDERGRVARYSAQGADIYVDGRYGKDYGTSIAAAKVTGIISRILSKNPGLKTQEIRTLLK